MPSDVRSILVRSARDEARRDGSRTIEAEHVLLALARRDETAAARFSPRPG